MSTDTSRGFITLRLGSTRGRVEVEGRLWATTTDPLLSLLRCESPIELVHLCPVLSGQIAITRVEYVNKETCAGGVADFVSIGAITAFGVSFEQVVEWCVNPQFKAMFPDAAAETE